jgi:hypothetical protein
MNMIRLISSRLCFSSSGLAGVFEPVSRREGNAVDLRRSTGEDVGRQLTKGGVGFDRDGAPLAKVANGDELRLLAQLGKRAQRDEFTAQRIDGEFP